MGLFGKRRKTGKDWAWHFYQNFSSRHTRDGALEVDGETFYIDFHAIASMTDRAFADLAPNERTIGYVLTLQWFAKVTPDDEGQLFARIWEPAAQSGYRGSVNRFGREVRDGTLTLPDVDIPLLAAVYAVNWGDLYVGGCLGLGEFIVFRNDVLIPELYATVEDWNDLPAGAIAEFADRNPLGTPEAALAALGPHW